MNRITDKQLEIQAARLNKLMYQPSTAYTRDASNKLRANIGHYHIDSAYGGVALHQMMNDGGGVDDIFRVGHVPKRELFNLIAAYIDGIQAERDRLEAWEVKSV